MILERLLIQSSSLEVAVDSTRGDTVISAISGLRSGCLQDGPQGHIDPLEKVWATNESNK
ncbi:hypothetical protein TorRG33x02_339230 [Trema orientale]|uniref:Uncharacterized protein n=1 Tax=Trema orientale TaxID=63057 RepID=A0A2P5AWR8_TREOI|nr:hypothetical protein TorRG33x02_339230 [Trema orientale]